MQPINRVTFSGFSSLKEEEEEAQLNTKRLFTHFLQNTIKSKQEIFLGCFLEF